MSSSEITTGTLDDYKALFGKLKNLCSIINCNFCYFGIGNKFNKLKIGIKKYILDLLNK